MVDPPAELPVVELKLEREISDGFLSSGLQPIKLSNKNRLPHKGNALNTENRLNEKLLITSPIGLNQIILRPKISGT
jgi:hypothetical protein